MNKQKLSILLTLICTISSQAIAYAPTNFYRPYDVDFHTYEWKAGHSTFRLGVFAETGNTDSSKDKNSDKKGTLQLYNETESSIGMLLGNPKGSFLYTLAESLGVSSATATDNGCRGRFLLRGKYKEENFTLFAKYKLPTIIDGIFEFGVFVPIRSMEFYDVSWTDQTKDVLSADLAFKEQVSDNVETFARTYGCLDINRCGWKASGIGDIVCMLGWQKDFAQEKQYLKNVRVHARAGVSIPTGKQKDENQALSLPLGLDGAWAIPANLGLDLGFVYNMRFGIELSFLGPFDATRTYRMKTSRNQTDFLLLHKGKATKSQGPMWQFILFGQAKKILPALSVMASYHFVKHDENRLSPKSYNFDYSIVNAAQSLQEWATHHFVFRGDITPWATDSKKKIKPQISLFYKVPVTGKRAILASTIGGQIAFSF